MQQKLQAFVLKTYETGNSSEVVHLLTRELGRLSVYARGVRKSKKGASSTLQPLSRIEISVYLREGSDLATFKEADLLQSYESILHDFERFSLGLLTSEVCAGAVEPLQAQEEVFDLLEAYLEDLKPESSHSALSATCKAFYILLALTGYEPEIHEELLKPWPEGRPKPHCFWLNTDQSLIHASGPAGSEMQWPCSVPLHKADFPIPPQAVRFLYNLRERKASSVDLEEDHGMQLLEGFIRLFERHHEGSVKAAQFWREVVGLAE